MVLTVVTCTLFSILWNHSRLWNEDLPNDLTNGHQDPLMSHRYCWTSTVPSARDTSSSGGGGLPPGKSPQDPLSFWNSNLVSSSQAEGEHHLQWSPGQQLTEFVSRPSLAPTNLFSLLPKASQGFSRLRGGLQLSPLPLPRQFWFHKLFAVLTAHTYTHLSMRTHMTLQGPSLSRSLVGSRDVSSGVPPYAPLGSFTLNARLQLPGKATELYTFKGVPSHRIPWGTTEVECSGELWWACSHPE